MKIIPRNLSKKANIVLFSLLFCSVNAKSKIKTTDQNLFTQPQLQDQTQYQSIKSVTKLTPSKVINTSDNDEVFSELDEIILSQEQNYAR